MTSITKTLATALTAAAVLSGTMAQADLNRPGDTSTLYYAQIDCWGSGLDHTGTFSDVHVKFVSKDGENAGVAKQSITNVEVDTVMKINPSFNPFTSAVGTFDHPRCGAVADAVYLSNTYEPFDLRHIEIEIKGDDAFWMDEVKIWRRDFNGSRIQDSLVAQFGRDNGNGWCLSTDRRDTDGSFKGHTSSSGCIKGFKFKVASEKVSAIR